MKQIFIKTSHDVYINASNVFAFEIVNAWSRSWKGFRLYARNDMDKRGILIYESEIKEKVEERLMTIIKSMNGGHGMNSSNGISIIIIDKDGNVHEENKEGEETVGDR